MPSRSRALVACALVACAAPACSKREAPAGTSSIGAPAADACGARLGVKWGLPFVKVCGGGPDAPPFWISEAPMACSKGEHEEMRCPTVTPIVSRASLGHDDAPIAPMQASALEATSAFRLCALRLAGRLPTRAERVRARATLGLATLLVTESSEGAGSFELRELPEWIAEGDCSNPSRPDATCRFEGYPVEGRLGVFWPGTRACAARELASAPTGGVVEMGGACAVPGFRWDAVDPRALGGVDAGRTPLPCALRLPIGLGGSRSFALACEPPGAGEPRHPAEGRTEELPYRCVVPESALDRIGGDAG